MDYYQIFDEHFACQLASIKINFFLSRFSTEASNSRTIAQRRRGQETIRLIHHVRRVSVLEQKSSVVVTE